MYRGVLGVGCPDVWSASLSLCAAVDVSYSMDIKTNDVAYYAEVHRLNAGKKIRPYVPRKTSFDSSSLDGLTGEARQVAFHDLYAAYSAKPHHSSAEQVEPVDDGTVYDKFELPRNMENPSRLTLVKRALVDLIGMAARVQPAATMALVTFNETAKTVFSGLSVGADSEALAAAIGRISSAGSTHIRAGIEQLIRCVPPHGATPTVAFLISDGEDPEAADVIVNAVNPLRDARHSVLHTIGCGEHDPRLLMQIAERGKGLYFNIADAAKLADLLNAFGEMTLTNAAVTMDVRISAGGGASVKLAPEWIPFRCTPDNATTSWTEQVTLQIDNPRCGAHFDLPFFVRGGGSVESPGYVSVELGWNYMGAGAEESVGPRMTVMLRPRTMGASATTAAAAARTKPTRNEEPSAQEQDQAAQSWLDTLAPPSSTPSASSAQASPSPEEAHATLKSGVQLLRLLHGVSKHMSDPAHALRLLVSIDGSGSVESHMSNLHCFTRACAALGLAEADLINAESFYSARPSQLQSALHSLTHMLLTLGDVLRSTPAYDGPTPSVHDVPSATMPASIDGQRLAQQPVSSWPMVHPTVELHHLRAYTATTLKQASALTAGVAKKCLAAVAADLTRASRLASEELRRVIDNDAPPFSSSAVLPFVHAVDTLDTDVRQVSQWLELVADHRAIPQQTLSSMGEMAGCLANQLLSFEQQEPAQPAQAEAQPSASAIKDASSSSSTAMAPAPASACAPVHVGVLEKLSHQTRVASQASVAAVQIQLVAAADTPKQARLRSRQAELQAQRAALLLVLNKTIARHAALSASNIRQAELRTMQDTLDKLDSEIAATQRSLDGEGAAKASAALRAKQAQFMKQTSAVGRAELAAAMRRRIDKINK